MDLQQGINSFIERSTSPKFRKSIMLQEAWEKIAPKSALDHTDNVVESNKKGNSIVIFVDTPHLAANLSMSKEYYRQMMEHETGYTIEDIFFIVSKKTGIRKKFQKQEQETPWYMDDCEDVPLDEGELAYARLSVESIEDEKLKETLYNAFVSDLEWKKGKKAKITP